ncbi:MAG: hypothetical protein LBV43_05820 [Prevotella sp.]|jgi:hypothetical protein|nr:hypothetical protein [Prevotella sp.]
MKKVNNLNLRKITSLHPIHLNAASGNGSGCTCSGDQVCDICRGDVDPVEVWGSGDEYNWGSGFEWDDDFSGSAGSSGYPGSGKDGSGNPIKYSGQLITSDSLATTISLWIPSGAISVVFSCWTNVALVATYNCQTNVFGGIKTASQAGHK